MMRKRCPYKVGCSCCTQLLGKNYINSSYNDAKAIYVSEAGGLDLQRVPEDMLLFD
jgi:hypothetical protein